MKTSRANSHSFRLHHIGRANSTRKTSQTFYQPDDSFKLAALNSVSRGVKHADLSFMTGNNLNKLRVQPLQLNEGQYNSAHNNLTDVRLRCDEMKKQRVHFQHKIDSLKEQIGKYSIFRQEYEDKMSEAKQKTLDLKTRLADKKSLLQETGTQKKILLNLEHRHRTDKVVYDQRKFQFEKQLEYQRKQLAIFKKQGKYNVESEGRTTKIYDKLAMELESQRLEREEHIRNLESMIEQKMQLQNINTEREFQLVEIAERAIQDKDHSQKQWRQIFLTHCFVNKMLRNKIDKEMDKFKTVEFAFKEIKTATGVSDAKTLVHKYLNKEAVYGELLGKIADNEKTSEQLKSETDELILQSKQLQIDREVLLSIKIKSQDLHDDIKKLEHTDEKAVTADSYCNKLRSWTNRQLKKFNCDKKPEDGNINSLVSMFLNVLSTEVDTVDPQEMPPKIEGQTFSHRQAEKITRVIPKRSRKNSAGDEIFDVEEEQAPLNAAQDQMELINNQHEAVIRENQKFMRELRRRKEEERKLLVEKKDVKKEVKVPEPKKEEDD